MHLKGGTFGSFTHWMFISSHLVNGNFLIVLSDICVWLLWWQILHMRSCVLIDYLWCFMEWKDLCWQPAHPLLHWHRGGNVTWPVPPQLFMERTRMQFWCSRDFSVVQASWLHSLSAYRLYSFTRKTPWKERYKLRFKWDEDILRNHCQAAKINLLAEINKTFVKKTNCL